MNTKTLIYGVNAILNLIKVKTQIINKIYILKNNLKIKIIEKKAKEKNINIKYVKNIENRNLLYLKKMYGVICKVNNINKNNIIDIIKQNDKAKILILDRIQDPHNLGSCIRTAEAFDLDAIIISKKNSAKLSPLINKISHSASLITPIITIKSIKNILIFLKKNNFNIIGMSAKAKNNLEGKNIKKPLAIIMGSEKNGIEKNIQNQCNYIYKIHLFGKLHNINVSVAAGVTLSKIIT